MKKIRADDNVLVDIATGAWVLLMLALVAGLITFFWIAFPQSLYAVLGLGAFVLVAWRIGRFLRRRYT